MNKLSDEMYGYNANLSLFFALSKEDKMGITKDDLADVNKTIGEWIKRVRELEDKMGEG